MIDIELVSETRLSSMPLATTAFAAVPRVGEFLHLILPHLSDTEHRSGTYKVERVEHHVGNNVVPRITVFVGAKDAHLVR